MKTYRKTATVQAKLFEQGDQDGFVHPYGVTGAMEDARYGIDSTPSLVPYIKTLENQHHTGEFGKHYLCIGIKGERWLVEREIFESTYEQVKDHVPDVGMVTGNDKDLFYQKQVMNPYPSESQSYTAYEKGFAEGYNKAKETIFDKQDVIDAVVRMHGIFMDDTLEAKMLRLKSVSWHIQNTLETLKKPKL